MASLTGPDFPASVDTGVNGENLTVTYNSAGDTTTAPVHTYSITGAISNGTGLASDYAATWNDGTLTVNKAHLTVKADSYSIVYGAAMPSLTYKITGFVNGETASVVSVRRISSWSRNPAAERGRSPSW